MKTLDKRTVSVKKAGRGVTNLPSWSFQVSTACQEKQMLLTFTLERFKRSFPNSSTVRNIVLLETSRTAASLSRSGYSGKFTNIQLCQPQRNCKLEIKVQDI